MTSEDFSTEVASEEAPKGSNVLLISIIVVLIVFCCCCIGVVISLYFLGDWIFDFIRNFFYQFGIYFQTL
jgi:hypothetical protein